MPETNKKHSSNPFIQLVRNFLNKFLQSPDVYPIKYYKKSKRFRQL